MMRCRPTPFLTTHLEPRGPDRTSTFLVSTLVAPSTARSLARADHQFGTERIRLTSSVHTRAFGIIFRLPEIEPCLRPKPDLGYSVTRERMELSKPSICWRSETKAH